MKKTLLLATTAMLLSTVAMNTNAASNSAELEIKAWFVKPMELMKEQYLGFGRILADEGNKRVVVKTDGTLDDTKTTATMISTASYPNYMDDNSYNDGALNEGIIRVKGFLDDEGIVGDEGSIDDINDQFLNAFLSIDVSDDSVDLTSGDIGCGTVSEFTTNVTRDNKDILIHIGGTLETASLSQTTSSLACDGRTTVTVIYNNIYDVIPEL